MISYVLIGIAIWLAVGYYGSYRTLKYGLLSDAKTLSKMDFFTFVVILPLCGILGFASGILSDIADQDSRPEFTAFGFKWTTFKKKDPKKPFSIRNPFFKEKV